MDGEDFGTDGGDGLLVIGAGDYYVEDGEVCEECSFRHRSKNGWGLGDELLRVVGIE